MDIYKPESYPWEIQYIIEEMETYSENEEEMNLMNQKTDEIQTEDTNIVYLQEEEEEPMWC